MNLARIAKISTIKTDLKSQKFLLVFNSNSKVSSFVVSVCAIIISVDSTIDYAKMATSTRTLLMRTSCTPYLMATVCLWEMHLVGMDTSEEGERREEGEGDEGGGRREREEGGGGLCTYNQTLWSAVICLTRFFKSVAHVHDFRSLEYNDYIIDSMYNNSLLPLLPSPHLASCSPRAYKWIMSYFQLSSFYLIGSPYSSHRTFSSRQGNIGKLLVCLKNMLLAFPSSIMRSCLGAFGVPDKTDGSTSISSSLSSARSGSLWWCVWCECVRVCSGRMCEGVWWVYVCLCEGV